VNAKDLLTTSWIRDTDTDIYFTIKSAKSPQCQVDGVGTIRSHHDNNV